MGFLRADLLLILPLSLCLGIKSVSSHSKTWAKRLSFCKILAPEHVNEYSCLVLFAYFSGSLNDICSCIGKRAGALHHFFWFCLFFFTFFSGADSWVLSLLYSLNWHVTLEWNRQDHIKIKLLTFFHWDQRRRGVRKTTTHMPYELHPRVLEEGSEKGHDGTAK